MSEVVYIAENYYVVQVLEIDRSVHGAIESWENAFFFKENALDKAIEKADELSEYHKDVRVVELGD